MMRKTLIFASIKVQLFTAGLFLAVGACKPNVEIVKPDERILEKTTDETPMFCNASEKAPELVGSLTLLLRDLQYPEAALANNIEGRVFVEFFVTETGAIRNLRVARGIGYGCDEEAIRLVQKAVFKPGMKRGIPIEVRYSLPVLFKLPQNQPK
jgi:protein TonB